MKTVEIHGPIQLGYPRHWWQFRRAGWYPHVDGLGRPCWIRFFWYDAATNPPLKLSVPQLRGPAGKAKQSVDGALAIADDLASGALLCDGVLGGHCEVVLALAAEVRRLRVEVDHELITAVLHGHHRRDDEVAALHAEIQRLQAKLTEAERLLAASAEPFDQACSIIRALAAREDV